MDGERSILLATARLAEQLQIVDETGDDIRVTAGETIALRYAYRVHETSKAEEQWAFALKITTEDHIAEERQTHRDRRFVTDVFRSNLQTTVAFQEPGEHEVHFEVSAEVVERPWGDQTPMEPVMQETLTGTLRVTAV